MIKSPIVWISCIVLIFSSCAINNNTPLTNLYGPAVFQSDIAYMPKPLSSDSTHHARYISAALIEGSGASPTNGNDEITRGEVSFGQGFTLPNFNAAYNVFGTLGSYSNVTDMTSNDRFYFNNKAFGAYGGRISANTYITSGRVDIRFIGFEMAFSHEFGQYADYRKSVTDSAYFYTNSKTTLVTLGGTSEVVWHSHDPYIQFGLRVFVGRSLGDNRYLNQGVTESYYNGYLHTSSLAYFMQIHQYFFVGELNATGGQFRIGFRF